MVTRTRWAVSLALGCAALLTLGSCGATRPDRVGTQPLQPIGPPPPPPDPPPQPDPRPPQPEPYPPPPT